MKIDKRSILLILILFFTISISAQNKGTGSVTGIVKDSLKEKPLEYVNIILQNTTDSSTFSGVVTDKNGIFDFEHVNFGTYLVKVSYLGYINKSLLPFKVDSRNRHIDLGTIYLRDTTITLEEIMVTSQKSLFNNEIDKKVYNVSRDIMSKTGSASDLLQNVPSVQVDIDGNVTLRGSSNVLIMVNGKTSPLMGSNQATVLQGIPANTIEKIEVITNPSAKYHPEGTSGIINIVLKKNIDTGFNGTINVNAGLENRYNGGFHLNYNTGDLNIFGGYNIRKDNRKRTNTDVRRQIDSASNIINYTENLNAGFKTFISFH